MNFVIKNAKVVNEGRQFHSDVLVRNGCIDKIQSEINTPRSFTEYDAEGLLLMPGMIDDQVHFREPGLTAKGDLATESMAAVAGGITSVMEMPNVSPATTNMSAIAHKLDLASTKSFCNYAFYLGATESNIDDIKSVDIDRVCGVKVFMGASTGNLLVENPAALEAIFRESPILIATHCESGPVIERNRLSLQDPLTIFEHAALRNDEACFVSSSYAVSLARKYDANLHVLHLTSAKEMPLFDSGPIEHKKITAEACVHHLWFDDQDYAQLGNLIKCNPAIKSAQDRKQLLQALRHDVLDIIATDHAPHLLSEKNQSYPAAPAGIPLVQHALLMLLDLVKQGELSIESMVQKACHNPAIRFEVKNRGFIREGYHADLVLLDPATPTHVSNTDTFYKCQWAPFDGQSFFSSVKSTWVNGIQCYRDGKIVCAQAAGQAIEFTRSGEHKR
ncbi:dihydroorotase [Aliidiomarina minuta]|uniref:Dihydroorotase n=1 Tax=Aliidiomarina minuta TaxID=880057 RepID=A0A432W9W5_9GAMM|nr:dihydroorotase [Aliidiomarina minuta]RUO26899.1 dihydroorotase [Aliidiomarina minuta]